MKKIILLAAGLFIFATATQAQEVIKENPSAEKANPKRLTPDQRADRNVAEMDKIVALTADQKVKIKELALAKIAKMEEIRTKYKDQPDLAKKEQRELRQNFIQSVNPILTADQQQKLKANLDEQKARKKAASQN